MHAWPQTGTDQVRCGAVQCGALVPQWVATARLYAPRWQLVVDSHARVHACSGWTAVCKVSLDGFHKSRNDGTIFPPVATASTADVPHT